MSFFIPTFGDLEETKYWFCTYGYTALTVAIDNGCPAWLAEEYIIARAQSMRTDTEVATYAQGKKPAAQQQREIFYYQTITDLALEHLPTLYNEVNNVRYRA